VQRVITPASGDDGVPCWSSWKTGSPSAAQPVSSMTKQPAPEFRGDADDRGGPCSALAPTNASTVGGVDLQVAWNPRAETLNSTALIHHRLGGERDQIGPCQGSRALRSPRQGCPWGYSSRPSTDRRRCHPPARRRGRIGQHQIAPGRHGLVGVISSFRIGGAPLWKRAPSSG